MFKIVRLTRLLFFLVTECSRVGQGKEQEDGWVVVVLLSRVVTRDTSAMCWAEDTSFVGTGASVDGEVIVWFVIK